MLIPLQRGIHVLMPDAPNFYPYSICMYLEGEQRAVIDFGAGIKAFNEIDKESIDWGIFSHFHPDHTHCAVLFPHSRLYCGQEEAEAYSDPQVHLHLQGGDLWSVFMKDKPVPNRSSELVDPSDIPVKPGFINVNIAECFSDGQVFDLGKGLRFQAVHLPGHTCGHYGFYFEKQGILFSGDIDLTRGGPWYGAGCSDVGQFIHSIRRVKEIDPGTLATSHRRPMNEQIQESLDTYLNILLDREKRLYDLLKTPHTIDEIAEHRLAFSKKIFELEEFWEKIYAHHHLKHLIEIGAVQEIEPGRYQQI